MHLQVINFLSEYSSRWPPQLINIKHTNGFNPVTLTDVDVNCSVVVAEADPQHIL